MSSPGAAILMALATTIIVIASGAGVDVPLYAFPLVLLLIPAGWVLDDYMDQTGGAF